MRLILLALIATVAAASAVCAVEADGGQPVPPAFKIGGETKYKPHQLVRLKAENIPDKAGLLWLVSPDEMVERASTADDVFEFAAHPGNYAVRVLAVRFDPATGKTTLKEARTTVYIESCQSPLPPIPDPPTPPQPNPPKPGGRLDPASAILKIQFGPILGAVPPAYAGCSCAVIGPRRADGRWNVLTAAHCTANVPPLGKLLSKTGDLIGAVRIAARDDGGLGASDVCWLVTEDAGLDLPYALLAEKDPPPGTKVWHAGYGRDRPGNREEGTLMAVNDWGGKNRYVLNVSSGDSGGPILTVDGNLVIGTVCCTRSKGSLTDMHAGGVAAIRRLMPTAAGASDTVEWSPLEIPLTMMP